MKKLVFGATIGAALLGISGQVAAACPGTPLSASALSTLLQGNTVCSGSAPNWTWQEQHRGSAPGPSPLWDYKRGPTDAVDPSEQVGTWNITSSRTGASTVTHTYGGSPFTYTVSPNGGNSFSFCPAGAGTQVEATVKNGQSSCP